MVKLFITLFCLISFSNLYAQKSISVKGNVKTEDGKGLAKASVSLYYIGLSDTLKTTTNEKGNYTFGNVQKRKTMIIISYVGYKKYADLHDYTEVTGDEINNDIVMTVGDNMLETVTIESSKIQIKEDTVSYKIDSTMFRKNDNVEEVLKRLPGVEVDKDGKVTAQGKEVTKVKVNGKEFFGGDVKTATRQLDADMVDRIQIIDDYGDQSAFTGVKDGDPTKTLNIQLKKDRNKGVFGNSTAGIGTDDRYLASLSLNKFNNAQQISFTGNLNNTNASTFDFSRIPGGANGAIASTMRSFGGGNFGNNDGIATTKSFGVNYRDDWSKKISVNGSYSFSRKSTFIESDVFQEFPKKNIDSSIFNNQATNNNSLGDNHRFSFNVEYRIDSFNYIKFNPGFTLRKQNDDNLTDFNYFYAKGFSFNSGSNKSNSVSNTPNFTGSLLYNRRFQKKGRTLSVNLTGGQSATDSDDDIYNTSLFYFNGLPASRTLFQNVIQDNNNHNYGVSASFNEQLSKKRSLEFNYAFNKRFVGNDRETFDVITGQPKLIDAQTNIFENIYTTNRFGANFRTTLKKYNYSIGLAVQPATIQNNSFTGTKLKLQQNIVNYFPVVRFAYNFSKSKSFNLNYNGNTNQPTVLQLQATPDFSNTQNIIFGNPDLRPEFTNTLSMRYNNFNFISGDVFFGNISASFVRDKIVNDVKIGTTRGALQETRYLNTNGYFNVNAFYTVSKPIKSRKYVFNYGGSVNFNNNISFLNSEKNTGKNWLLTQRFSMDYKIKKWLETNVGVSYNLNDVTNTLSANTNIKGWNFTNSSRLFFKHDFILSYDVTKSLNQGFSNNVTFNPLIINGSLEKQIFKNKNASVKLQAFDLLNENTNIGRTVSPLDASITDTRTNRLQRYFMLSFVYRFNKFKGASSGGPGMQGMPGGGRGEVRMMGM